MRSNAMTARLLASIIVLLTFAGCVPNTMYHADFNKSGRYRL